MKLKKNAFYNLFFIFSFLILSLLSVSIMAHAHFIPGGADSLFHFKRIMELKESLEHSILPQFSFNYFHGSAVMTFYPYLNLLPMIFLSFIIKDKILFFYSFIGLYVFLSFLTSFFGSINISKSWRISYLFSLFYVMSNIYMYYSFANMDMGVVSSLAWLPLAIFGFINLITKKNKWLELSIGMTLIIFSHILTTIMIIMLLLFWLILNYRKINYSLIINILKAVILTILSTTIVWLPALLFNKFNSITPPGSVKLSGSPLSSIMKDDWTSYGFSIVALIGLVLGFVLYKRFKSIEKQMYIISVITIFICSNLFPWNYLPTILSKYLDYFQFTPRFLIIPHLMLTYLSAAIVLRSLRTNKTKNIVLIIMAFLSIGLQLQNQSFLVNININNYRFNNNFISTYTNTSDSKNKFHTLIIPTKSTTNTNIFTNTPDYKLTNNKDYYNLINPNNFFSSNDYNPKVFNLYNGVQSNEGMVNSHYIEVLNSGFNKFKFNNNEPGKITIPVFYYNHENINAYIDNKKIHIKHNQGVMQINNIKRGNHILKIIPLPSYHIRFSILLTTMGFICYIIEIIFLLFRKLSR